MDINIESAIRDGRDKAGRFVWLSLPGESNPGQFTEEGARRALLAGTALPLRRAEVAIAERMAGALARLFEDGLVAYRVDESSGLVAWRSTEVRNA